MVRRMSDTRTMSVREFLRGGYKEPGGPIIVLSGSEVALVAFPGTTALSVTPPVVGTNGNGHAYTAPKTTPLVVTTSAPPFRPVPKPGKKR